MVLSLDDFENRIYNMDSKYDANFGDWIRNEDNARIVGYHLRKYIDDYSTEDFIVALKWIVKDWTLRNIIVLVQKMIFEDFESMKDDDFVRLIEQSEGINNSKEYLVRDKKHTFKNDIYKEVNDINKEVNDYNKEVNDINKEVNDINKEVNDYNNNINKEVNDYNNNINNDYNNNINNDYNNNINNHYNNNINNDYNNNINTDYNNNNFNYNEENIMINPHYERIMNYNNQNNDNSTCEIKNFYLSSDDNSEKLSILQMKNRLEIIRGLIFTWNPIFISEFIKCLISDFDYNSKILFIKTVIQDFDSEKIDQIVEKVAQLVGIENINVIKFKQKRRRRVKTLFKAYNVI
ncbi:hypothetical protein DMUE_3424 [Dictyocoela muelleri]|nr:hypothetical protein DMUE_3424 [Dictyocoela muelleri]